MPNVLHIQKFAVPTSSADSSTAVSHPVSFRLPVRGVDPHFGLTRSYYYQLEAEGRLELIRLRSKGKSRGVTLVPYDEVKALIDGQRR